MPVALITQSSVRVLGVVLLLVGLGGLVLGYRLRRWDRPAAGAGALLSTVGAVLIWLSLARIIDGPAGWPRVRVIFASLFGSWPWVAVFALIAAVLWLGVAIASARRWDGARALAIVVGTALAAIGLGLLDASISPF